MASYTVSTTRVVLVPLVITDVSHTGTVCTVPVVLHSFDTTGHTTVCKSTTTGNSSKVQRLKDQKCKFLVYVLCPIVRDGSSYFVMLVWRGPSFPLSVPSFL